MKNPIGFLSSTQNHHHYLYAESKTETAEKLRPEQKGEGECSETTFDLEVTWSIITLIFPMCITVILL